MYRDWNWRVLWEHAGSVVSNVVEKRSTFTILATIATTAIVTLDLIEGYDTKNTRPGLLERYGLRRTAIIAWKRLSHLCQTTFATWSQSVHEHVSNALEESKYGKVPLQRASRDRQAPNDNVESSGIDQVRRNIILIDQVLEFWFSAGPDVAQKKLWMIAAEKDEWRKQADADITERFGDLVAQPPTVWWTDSTIYSYRGKIAAIILLDQFSRHVRRHNEVRCCKEGFPSQAELDALAFQVAEDLFQSPLVYTMLPIPMLVFALLPFRHRSTIPALHWTQRQTDTIANLYDQYDDMIRRFRKATNRRLALLQDDDRRGMPSCVSQHSDEDILECCQFQADLSTASKHIVYKTIASFLQNQSINDDIIVSLSGGVDSMVILSVLSLILPNVTAVHIDYGNRPESLAEADFLRRYCEQIGTAFHCRRINEVTRGVTARDEYERLSRTIRYDSYKQHSNREIPRVMLGHHRGDLRENVLSNAHKGSGPLDLSGMAEVSTNAGVQMLRPLLSIEKKHIFHYAHTYGVPYFKDTTPHWSTRGKLRNKLLPLLCEIYGDGSMNNLSQLAVESDELRDLLYSTLVGPFLNDIERECMGISFATQSWRSLGLFFWKFVLREALHSVGLGMFSDKGVAYFHERVCEAKSIRAGWLQLRKDYAVYVNKGGRVFVLYPESFPWSKNDAFNLPSSPVKVDGNGFAQVGPWCITASPAVVFTDDMNPQLEEKAIPSMEYFMKGSIDYHIRVPMFRSDDESLEVTPLVFRNFRKENRPPAWKHSDLRIQEALPLLCNDSKAEFALYNGQHASVGVVKVSLRRSKESRMTESKSNCELQQSPCS